MLSEPIELCGGCNGLCYTTTEEGTHYGASHIRHVCVACEGRGCKPIPSGALFECPNCKHKILASSIVPQGSCVFCKAALMLMLPQCLLPVIEKFTHSLFHDNSSGAGYRMNLQRVVEHLRGPRAIAMSERDRIIHPGHRSTFSRVVSPFPHSGSLVIELGRFENRGGELVEELLQRVEVTATPTLGNR